LAERLPPVRLGEIAGYIGWNPLDVLDKPTLATRAVNAQLTRLCVTFTVVMTKAHP
jgi:hypothetical protein